MGELLFFHFRVTNVKVIYEKKNPHKHHSSNVLEPLEIETIPYNSKMFYNSMFWGCPSILKSSSGTDMLSNRCESITFLFRGYIPFGFRDIQVQSFDYVTSSYLRWWACSQTLAILAALVDTLAWAVVDSWKMKLVFQSKLPLTTGLPKPTKNWSRIA